MVSDRYGANRLSEIAHPAKEYRGTASQRAMMDLIEREVTGAGYPRVLAAAFVVNAVEESGLNPAAVQPGAAVPGIGLFQLTGREDGGGKGTYAQRKDPSFNTRYMIGSYELSGTPGRAVRSALDRGAGVDTLAALVARDLERCGACAGSDGTSELRERAATARRMFPSLPSTGDVSGPRYAAWSGSSGASSRSSISERIHRRTEGWFHPESSKPVSSGDGGGGGGAIIVVAGLAIAAAMAGRRWKGRRRRA